MNYVIASLILICTIQLKAQSFTPGLWKSQESIKLNGISLPGSSDEECITPAQGKDAKATIDKYLKKKKCWLTKWSVKNKKLDAALECDNDDMKAKGALTGSFAEKSYDLKADAKGTYKNILPANAHIKLSGQWVRACTK